MSVNTKIRVIVGPYHLAKRYAERFNFHGEDVIIVTRGHQLAKLNPADIAGIITVRLNALGARIARDIAEETRRIRSLWPITIQAAA